MIDKQLSERLSVSDLQGGGIAISMVIEQHTPDGVTAVIRTITLTADEAIALRNFLT